MVMEILILVHPNWITIYNVSQIRNIHFSIFVSNVKYFSGKTPTVSASHWRLGGLKISGSSF